METRTKPNMTTALHIEPETWRKMWFLAEILNLICLGVPKRCKKQKWSFLWFPVLVSDHGFSSSVGW